MQISFINIVLNIVLRMQFETKLKAKYDKSLKISSVVDVIFFRFRYVYQVTKIGRVKSRRNIFSDFFYLYSQRCLPSYGQNVKSNDFAKHLYLLIGLQEANLYTKVITFCLFCTCLQANDFYTQVSKAPVKCYMLASSCPYLNFSEKSFCKIVRKPFQPQEGRTLSNRPNK